MTMQVNGPNAAEKEELVARYSSSYGRSMIGRLLDAPDGGLNMVCFSQGLAMSILTLLPSFESKRFGFDTHLKRRNAMYFSFA